MSEIEHRALEAAARDALLAPSVFNTQPWRWRISGTALELRADWSRQLTVTDPDGHALLLSCGAALHHARVSLAGGRLDGRSAGPRRTVDDLLARVCIVEAAPSRTRPPSELRRRDQPASHRPPAVRRRTRSGGCADALWARPPTPRASRLHRVRLDQMPMLAIAVSLAGADEMADPEYRIELDAVDQPSRVERGRRAGGDRRAQGAAPGAGPRVRVATAGRDSRSRRAATAARPT